MQDLKGRKAVVSGGGSGIGKAVAQLLQQAGAATAIADVQLPTEPDKASLAYTCDVTQPSSIDALFAQVRQQLGAPDILVCSAGLGIHERLTEGDPDKWQHVLNTNIMGTLRLVRAFAPAMLEAGSGDVVIISSVAARQPYTYGGVYAASKAALEVIAETLRLETLPKLRVTVIAPGVTDTDFFQNTLSGHQTVESIGYGAISPQEVADAVLYALQQPAGASINNITLRPRAQPF